MSENYFNKYYGAFFYDELEEYQTAIEELTEYVEINKQNPFAYNNRGVALWEIGKREDAIKDFERAIELSSNDSQPYLNLGHLFEAEGNIKKAIELYTKVIDINKDVSALKSGHILFFCVFAAFAARCRLRRAVRFFLILMRL